MKKFFYKALSIFFALGFIGSLSETYRIFTSSAQDITSDRTYLSVMAIGMSFLFLWITILFWKKGKKG